MPTKKSAPQKAQGSDMGMVWKWLYVIGFLVAALAGAIGFKNEILTWILILVGVLLGLFYFDPEDIEHFGLRVLVLIGAIAAATQMGLGSVPAVGSFILGFFSGLVGFLGPVILAMALVWLWKNLVSTLF